MQHKPPHVDGWQVAGKSWTALVGAFLAFLVPSLLQWSLSAPPPWPAVVGALVSVLTAVGVYNAPYRPHQGATTTPSTTPSPLPTQSKDTTA